MVDNTSSGGSEPLFESADLSVARITGLGRLALRARGDLAPFDGAFGADLPRRIGHRASADGAEILCLGPDEWAITAPLDKVGAITQRFAALYDAHPHSLVDVSGREMRFDIFGPRAAELLTLGCPRDIDSISAGQGRRTVFDGASVVLWRANETEFSMDVWNSFAPHVEALLTTGCRELLAETH